MARASRGDSPPFLRDGGSMGEAMRSYAWASTSLGPPGAWPSSLRTLVGLMLAANQPMFVAWGGERTLLYNDGYSPMLGRKHGTALGRPFFAVWPEVEAMVAPLFDRVFAGEAVHMDDITLTLERREAKEEAHFAFSYTPVQDDEGAILGLFCACTETTETVGVRARADAERERLWRNSEDILVVIDLDGAFQAVSPVVTKILGWTPEEMIGRSVFDFVIADDQPSTSDALAFAAADALPNYGNRYRHKAGGFRWISWVAAPEHELIFATGRHVTAEKEAAEALAELQARLRAIFETSYQLQAFLSLDGTVLDANATALEAMAARREDIVGAPFWETPWFAAPPGMAEQIRDCVAAAARGEHVHLEISVEVAAGTRAYDFTLRPIRTLLGGIVGIVPEAIDITARRHVEEALRQAQKMEALGQLTGGIAHDFNNLLTGIIGSLDVVRRRMATDRIDDVPRFLDAATTSAQRAAALTHRLLAFARRQSLDVKATDVNRLVSSLKEILHRTLGEQIALETVLGAELWPALTDANQLENAILNLAINARDAMPRGGHLTIETANTRLDEAYSASDKDVEAGDYVVIGVSDTGMGMPPEVIAKAFDPFFTTKPIGQGTGLGLSMIYGFVKQANGHIRIYSEIDRGTTIKLYLPRGSGEPATHASTAVVEAPRGRGETILVVEDEATVRLLVVETLTSLGYRHLEAVDANAATSLLRSDARIDLLLTDVGLPDMNGRDLAEIARETRPDLKVLFVTGYAENAAVRGGFLVPGMDMLSKPFGLEALGAKIHAMLQG